MYGEALIDVVVDGDDVVETPGGSPANVALGLGRLGVEVALLTAIGADERGLRIADRLQDSGVLILPESLTAARTSIATASIDPDGNASYDFDIDWNPAPAVVDPRPKLLHTGSLAAFLLPGAQLVLNAMRQLADCEVTFDPNIRHALVGERKQAVSQFEEAAELATVLKLSDEDARWLYPDRPPEATVRDWVRRGSKLVVLTQGAAGAVLANRAATVQVPAPRVVVADTIGAGDAFMASLIASLLRSPSDELQAADLLEAGSQAACAAAITVARSGADPPSRDELDAAAWPRTN